MTCHFPEFDPDCELLPNKTANERSFCRIPDADHHAKSMTYLLAFFSG